MAQDMLNDGLLARAYQQGCAPIVGLSRTAYAELRLAGKVTKGPDQRAQEKTKEVQPWILT